MSRAVKIHIVSVVYLILSVILLVLSFRLNSDTKDMLRKIRQQIGEQTKSHIVVQL